MVVSWNGRPYTIAFNVISGGNLFVRFDGVREPVPVADIDTELTHFTIESDD